MHQEGHLVQKILTQQFYSFFEGLVGALANSGKSDKKVVCVLLTVIIMHKAVLS